MLVKSEKLQKINIFLKYILPHQRVLSTFAKFALIDSYYSGSSYPLDSASFVSHAVKKNTGSSKLLPSIPSNS